MPHASNEIDYDFYDKDDTLQSLASFICKYIKIEARKYNRNLYTFNMSTWPQDQFAPLFEFVLCHPTAYNDHPEKICMEIEGEIVPQKACHTLYCFSELLHPTKKYTLVYKK